MILTILIFVIILGLLVFVHEFGHFYVAKRSGMLVQEFGFGFPPRMFGVQRVNGKFRLVWGRKEPMDPNSTVYSMNWIPLGGFVKILGENNERAEHPGSFINKSFSKRFATLVAGVIMNVILAWVLLSIGFISGLPTGINSNNDLPKGSSLRNSQVAIVEVQENSPAFKAGIKPGDFIVSVDGISMNQLDEVRDYIKSNQGKEFNIQVKRINENMNFVVESLASPKEGEGPTGIVLTNVGLLSFPWYTSFWEGAKATIYSLETIVAGLYGLITSGRGLDSLGGPVKIAQITGQAASLGFVYILQLAAFLSLNLAILNILPFPALDGGRVAFLIIEKIRGKRNNQKVEQLVNTAGFIFLLLLMVLVTYKDIKAF